MAGVMMTGDEGMGVKNTTVPPIGGVEYKKSIGLSSGATPEVAGGHVDTNQFGAEGVAYPENFGVNVTTKAYPEGTRMVDNTPGDDAN